MDSPQCYDPGTFAERIERLVFIEIGFFDFGIGIGIRVGVGIGHRLFLFSSSDPDTDPEFR